MKASESLNGEQERTLKSLLNLIVPPSEDGKMPGAADVGFLSYAHNKDLSTWVREGLLRIVEESHRMFGQEFSSLSGYDQMQIIDSLRRRLFRFFGRLTTQVIQCYYQHDQVLDAIGHGARTPFPYGYIVEDGDLMLLAPVYERGKIYRDLNEHCKSD